MRKIAIVGTAPATINEAPFDNHSWEIWSLNGAYKTIKRYDLWFELHPWDMLVNDGLSPCYYDNLKSKAREGVLITLEPFPDHDNPRILPRDKIVEKCGDYITSSISWMIGLAILEGVDEIGIWGVEMAGAHEYQKQRASCEAMLSLAKGLGIKITLPEKCPLLKCSQYPSYLSIDLQMMSDLAESEYNRFRDNMNYNRGIADAAKKLQHKWG